MPWLPSSQLLPSWKIFTLKIDRWLSQCRVSDPRRAWRVRSGLQVPTQALEQVLELVSRLWIQGIGRKMITNMWHFMIKVTSQHLYLGKYTRKVLIILLAKVLRMTTRLKKLLPIHIIMPGLNLCQDDWGQHRRSHQPNNMPRWKWSDQDLHNWELCVSRIFHRR